MDIQELIRKNRSYRRFCQSERITVEQLEKWIALARFSASGRNMQPLKYALSTEESMNNEIFGHLAWAGYLSGWAGPSDGEKPAAYIVVLHDKHISDNYFCDDGIAMQSILLGAVSDGYGGCIIGSVNRVRVSAVLKLPSHLHILWVIALGKPAEIVTLHDLEDDNIRYWRDENNIHHVPKRKLKDLIWQAR